MTCHCLTMHLYVRCKYGRPTSMLHVSFGFCMQRCVSTALLPTESGVQLVRTRKANFRCVTVSALNRLVDCFLPAEQGPASLVSLQLTCGHRCPLTCHPGPCPPHSTCKKKISLKCPCKRIKKVSLVSSQLCVSKALLYMQDFRCCERERVDCDDECLKIIAVKKEVGLC